MANITHFKIFDSTGNPLNTRVEGDVLIIPLNLERISTGLISTQTIYVLEKTSSTGGVKSLDKPLLYSANHQVSSNEEKFFFFDVENDEILKNEIPNLLGFVNQLPQTYVGDYRESNSPNAYPMILNIGFLSSEGGNFEGDLSLKIGQKKILFKCYCESVEQDDRFVNLLERFGEKIGVEEERIFSQTDIHNDIQDNLFLNSRRQEYLNLVSELQVYFPTVRGYDTMLYYFGWKDILKIKEYYFDPNENKFRQFDLNSQDSDKKRLVKMAQFGLFYQINKVDYTSVDENGNPTTYDVLEIPYEELAIKMFYLKRFLESRNIGGISKIVDIIGEKTNFSKLVIRNWNNKSEFWNINKDVIPTLEVLEHTGYIKDIRKYYPVQCQFSPDDDFSETQVYELGSCSVVDLSESDSEMIIAVDDPFMEIGSKLILRNNTFDITWDDVDPNWFMDGSPQVVTWLNIGGVMYYSGVITISGELGYFNEISFDTNTTSEFEIILPNIGYYDVTIKIIGFDGRNRSKLYKKLVFVTPYQIEIASFYKIHDRRLQVWETNFLSWENINSSWLNNIYDNSQFQIGSISQSFDLFNIANYLLYRNKFGFGELSWEEYVNQSFEDLRFLSFGDMVFDAPKPPSAIGSSFESPSNFYLGGDNYEVPEDINPYNMVMLSGLFETQYENMNFVPRIDKNEQRFVHIFPDIVSSNSDFYVAYKNGETDVRSSIKLESFVSFVQGIGYWGSWEELAIPWEYCENLWRTNMVSEPFNTDNIRVYNNEFNLPKYVPFFLTNEVSQIVGKVSSRTVILDEDGVVVASTIGNDISHRFQKEGLYSIKLEVVDNEGNTHTNFRKNIIKVLNHEEYEKL
jgi:hypothetical protein